MKLLNDFFRIVEADSQEGRLTCRVALNPEHYIYRAHFPGRPVTPGVCLMQMATEILEQQFDKEWRFDTAVSIKFKNPVLPTDEVVFDFTKIAFEEEVAKVSLTVSDENRQFLSMSLKYRMVV